MIKMEITQGSKVFSGISPVSNRSRKRLRKSEEKYRILIDHSQNGIFLAQDGILLFCNQAFTDMIGYTPEEVRGRPITDFIAPEDRSMVLDRHLRRTTGTALPESYEFRLLHKDGSTRVFVSMSVGTTSYRGPSCHDRFDTGYYTGTGERDRTTEERGEIPDDCGDIAGHGLGD